jgi:hypothetical protein
MKKTIIGLIPNVSYNDFVLGSNISNYLNREHTKQTYCESTFINDSYHFINEDIDVWCEIDGIINTIRCSSSCIYRGVELIGLDFSQFISYIKKNPDDEDVIYISGTGKRGQNQHVYEFDTIGLQIWVWRNKIRTVMISKYEE